MKTTLITLITLFSIITYSQNNIGINTSNPQKALHVAGSNSNVRVEGLNSTNNVNNNGVNDTRVFIDANGDFKLKPSSPRALVNLLGNSLFPTSTTISSATGSITTTSITTGNFNMLNSNFVEITFEITVNNILTTSNTKISDGASYLLGVNILIDGVVVMYKTNDYTCSNNTGTILNGGITIRGSFFKKLTPGAHTFSIEGIVKGGSGFKADFGGNTLDRIQILEFD